LMTGGCSYCPFIGACEGAAIACIGGGGAAGLPALAPCPDGLGAGAEVCEQPVSRTASSAGQTRCVANLTFLLVRGLDIVCSCRLHGLSNPNSSCDSMLSLIFGRRARLRHSPPKRYRTLVPRPSSEKMSLLEVGEAVISGVAHLRVVIGYERSRNSRADEHRHYRRDRR
jgi:hypothetical protein